MHYFIVQRVTRALNQAGKTIRGAKILVLGLAYKKDVDDMRESPALKIIDLLKNSDAQVTYNDPHIQIFRGTRLYPDLFMESAP